MNALKNRKALTSAVGLLALLAIIVIVNLASSWFYARFDITEAKTYSLTEGTKRMLGSLPQDVTLKFFYSASLKGQPGNLKAFADRVRDLLREYVNSGKGAVTLESFDPKLDSDEEEWALKYGLTRMPISNSSDSDGYFYLGIVAESLGENASLPFVDPRRERYLEYDVSQLIFQVMHPEKKTFGIVSSLPICGTSKADMYGMQSKGVEKPWIIVNELKRSYNVKEIKPEEGKIPEGIDVLMVVHPKNFSEDMLCAIDQYVMKGGKAMFFVDPLCTADRDEKNPMMPFGASDLNVLFEKWGFTVDSSQIVADLEYPTVLNNQGAQDKNPLWLSPTAGAFNEEEILTAQLDSLLLPICGSIAKKSGGVTTITPLVHTSLSAQKLDKMKAFEETSAIRMTFNSSVTNMPLVAKISGLFESAFAGRSNCLERCQSPSTIVVFCDADMLVDSYNIRPIGFLGMQAYQPLNNNYTLVLNTANLLCGDENLIAIRARDSYERPFTVVRNLEKKAQDEWLSKEQELSAQYEALQRQLYELQMKKDDAQRTIISPEQEKKIKEFQSQRQTIAKQLKAVRRNLNRDKEFLGFKLRLFNIVLIPLLVAVIGIALSLIRQYKVRQR